MARISREAQEILGEDFLGTVNTADRYTPLWEVVEEGWVADRGAALLASFRESYVGDRNSFHGIGNYEAAVNGRGIPDSDLTGIGSEQVKSLMRRGVAFAWDALRAAGALPWTSPVVARVSVAPILMDPDVFTGYVTFVSSEFMGELGLDPGRSLPGIQIVLSDADCVNPLPVGPGARGGPGPHLV